jgi:hypothetical protein
MSDFSNVNSSREINRLHDEISRLTADSRQALLGALAAAWQAGKLLNEEKKRVWMAMGRGAWVLWLEKRFHGTPRTAQNYMRLAEETPDVSAFQGLSLRQVYLRLGIATEPKSRIESARVKPLPTHIRLASKLLMALKPCLKDREAMPEQWEAYRHDLRPLYEQLRRLFESSAASKASSNLSRAVESDRNGP